MLIYLDAHALHKANPGSESPNIIRKQWKHLYKFEKVQVYVNKRCNQANVGKADLNFS